MAKEMTYKDVAELLRASGLQPRWLRLQKLSNRLRLEADISTGDERATLERLADEVQALSDADPWYSERSA